MKTPRKGRFLRPFGVFLRSFAHAVTTKVGCEQNVLVAGDGS